MLSTVLQNATRECRPPHGSESNLSRGDVTEMPDKRLRWFPFIFFRPKTKRMPPITTISSGLFNPLDSAVSGDQLSEALRELAPGE